MNEPVKTTDFATITERQQATWACGDFHQIARQNVVMAEALCQALDPHADQAVLDVACGSGTAALVAARRYCRVTGIDYVPELIQRAQLRARADDLEATFQVADAQRLPFPDDSFDTVMSVYGVQFAPDQEQAAAEMLRVCRPGGKIGLATPLSAGWSGDFFRTNANYVPLPPGTQSPLRWGSDEGVNALLGGGCRSIRSEKRTALQYYRSIDHAVELFLTYFGPAIRAAQTDDGARLRNDLCEVFNRYNRADDGTAVIENTYLLTIAVVNDE